MKPILSICLLVLLFSCHSETETKIPRPDAIGKELPDFKVALNFINDYASFCDRQVASHSDTAELDWIDKHPLLTRRFKTTYERILDSANKADPELGLDSDPIFDAQDYPDKGFSILNQDTTNGYVTVVGNDWKNFKLVLKLTKQQNKWLVDGAGIVNIPLDKRASR